MQGAAGDTTSRRRRPRFDPALLVLGLGAFALRAVILFQGVKDSPLKHDGPEYRGLGIRLVKGLGFTDPWPESQLGIRRQTAVHGPLASLWSAAGDALGFDSNQGQRLWACLLGAATVVALGFVASRFLGRDAGRLAALAAAVYPNFWQNDLMVMNETPGQFLTVVLVGLGLRYAKRPTAARAAQFGAVTAVAALARPELILVLATIPIIAWRSGDRLAAVGRHVGAAALWVAVALLPWVGWNLYRFERPVGLTTGMDLTFAQTDCPRAFYGDGTGSWSALCMLPVNNRLDLRYADESTVAAQWRKLGLDYARDHQDRLPAVVVARVGRTFGFSHVTDQFDLEVAEGRSRTGLWVGWGMFVGLVALCFPGVGAVRRRGLSLLVLAAPVVAVAIGVALARGGLRFRAPAEVPLVFVASAGLADLLHRARRRRRAAAAIPPAAAATTAGRPERVPVNARRPATG